MRDLIETLIHKIVVISCLTSIFAMVLMLLEIFRKAESYIYTN